MWHSKNSFLACRFRTGLPSGRTLFPGTGYFRGETPFRCTSGDKSLNPRKLCSFCCGLSPPIKAIALTVATEVDNRPSSVLIGIGKPIHELARTANFLGAFVPMAEDHFADRRCFVGVGGIGSEMPSEPMGSACA